MCNPVRNFLNLREEQARTCCRGRCKSSAYTMTARQGTRRYLIRLNKAEAV
nr:MAG TPA: hypothetical protein [Caudoviricetes sp.]